MKFGLSRAVFFEFKKNFMSKLYYVYEIIAA
jgi:hypothetical protein